MRITEAAQCLGISPRMLRYRESLGLLPPVRMPQVRDGAAIRRRATTAAPGHRQFGEADLDAVSLGLAIEQRYDISPAALAFGLRVLADPAARAQVAELGRRVGRIRPLPAMALDFEKERAQRLLSRGRTLCPKRSCTRRSHPRTANSARTICRAVALGTIRAWTKIRLSRLSLHTSYIVIFC